MLCSLSNASRIGVQAARIPAFNLSSADSLFTFLRGQNFWRDFLVYTFSKN